jgi:hypothetical protein
VPLKTKTDTDYKQKYLKTEQARQKLEQELKDSKDSVKDMLVKINESSTLVEKYKNQGDKQ